MMMMMMIWPSCH